MTLRMLPAREPTLDERRTALIDRAVDDLAAHAHLTPREREIARRLAHGARGVEVCRELGLLRDTYKGHTRRLYAKTGTDDAEHWRAQVYTTVIRWLLEGSAHAPARARPKPVKR